METIAEVLGILIIIGLPALALVGIGVWAVRRESRTVARSVGYVLLAGGVILGIYTVAALINGPFMVTVGTEESGTAGALVWFMLRREEARVHVLRQA